MSTVWQTLALSRYMLAFLELPNLDVSWLYVYYKIDKCVSGKHINNKAH